MFKIAKNPTHSASPNDPNDPFGDAEATEAVHHESLVGSRGADGAVHVPARDVAVSRHRTALAFSIGERRRRISTHRGTLLPGRASAVVRLYVRVRDSQQRERVEAIYPAPDAMTAELEKQMVDNPFEARSDSFYFVEGTLVMHNKAVCEYSE